jgi:hypothetical protein
MFVDDFFTSTFEYIDEVLENFQVWSFCLMTSCWKFYVC